MSDFNDLSTPKIAVVGFISATLVFALIVLLQAMFYWTEAEQRIVKDVDQPYVEFATLTADQQAKLASYHWVDQQQNIVAIPIKRAMELVMNDLSKQQSKSDNSSSKTDSTLHKEPAHAQ
jgi:hypothetical protein